MGVDDVTNRPTESPKKMISAVVEIRRRDVVHDTGERELEKLLARWRPFGAASVLRSPIPAW